MGGGSEPSLEGTIKCIPRIPRILYTQSCYRIHNHTHGHTHILPYTRSYTHITAHTVIHTYYRTHGHTWYMMYMIRSWPTLNYTPVETEGESRRFRGRAKAMAVIGLSCCTANSQQLGRCIAILHARYLGCHTSLIAALAIMPNEVLPWLLHQIKC